MGDKELRRQYTRFISVGRLGSPRELAEAVLALVYNPCITAQTASVGSGIHQR